MHALKNRIIVCAFIDAFDFFVGRGSLIWILTATSKQSRRDDDGGPSLMQPCITSLKRYYYSPSC
jgi:hypothetical protein